MEKAGMKVIQGGNQLSLIRDTEEVLKFLEFVGKKSILDEHAIHCRLTACHNLFSVINEEEDNLEYILANLELFINRFRNKSKSVNEATLKVYKSRVKSSLEDYKAWSNDPFAWERKLNEKKAASQVQRRSKKVAKAPTQQVEARAVIQEPVQVKETVVPEVKVLNQPSRKISFPIRSDFNVEVTIPEGGLTLKELNRLGMFLYPYCNDVEMAPSIWTNLTH
jgi:hypothetical protein